jgi:L-amino acid N-acyltransferase YncA
MWRRATARPSHSLLVAEREGRVIGFVSVGPTTDEGAAADTGEVYAIYLHPDIVGTGVGRALFARGSRT